jgi:GT2 family glycosyltransferase
MAGKQALPKKQNIVAIIINYNGGEQILDCIHSLTRQTLIPDQIVVVDNQSTDGSLNKVRHLFPNVTTIENGYNAGWGIGCNVGIQSTKSEYIALINNDAYLDFDCLEEMVRAIQLRPDYGSCASKILLWDDPRTIEAAGVAIYMDGSSIGRGRLQPVEQYTDLKEIFCANDCCCLYRRQMIEDIGLYDPDFFIYCDETDIGWRQQLAGWRCVYAPKAIAYHAHSKSAGSYTDFKAYHVERNRVFLCLKYFPFPYFVASFFFALHRYIFQVWLSRKGKGALAKYRRTNSMSQGLKILIKSQRDALKKISIMFQRRREFYSRHPFSTPQFATLLRLYGVTPKKMASYE